jgi:hypothetical protein
VSTYQQSKDSVFIYRSLAHDRHKNAPRLLTVRLLRWKCKQKQHLRKRGVSMRKFSAVLMCILLFGSLLAACGGKDNKAADNSKQQIMQVGILPIQPKPQKKISPTKKSLSKFTTHSQMKKRLRQQKMIKLLVSKRNIRM